MLDGGVVPLREAHDRLDLAVLESYGWDKAVLENRPNLLGMLFDLNESCAADLSYDPFGKLAVGGEDSLNF